MLDKALLVLHKKPKPKNSRGESCHLDLSEAQSSTTHVSHHAALLVGMIPFVAMLCLISNKTVFWGGYIVTKVVLPFGGNTNLHPKITVPLM